LKELGKEELNSEEDKRSLSATSDKKSCKIKIKTQMMIRKTLPALMMNVMMMIVLKRTLMLIRILKG